MKKKHILLSLFLLIMTQVVSAQELTIKGMTMASNDISASQYERKDFNGKACALVKVRMAATGTIFEGNVIQPVEHKTNEYWVYMTEGSKELHIKHPNYITREIHFADYGINGLQSHTTYTLTVSLPQAVPAQTQKLIINYAPANATVLIDSKLYRGNGRIEAILPVGTHQYIIAADGFASAEATVKLTAEAPRTVTEQLASVATVELQSQETVTQQNISTPIESQTAIRNKGVSLEEVERQIASHVNDITIETNTVGDNYIKCSFGTSLLFTTNSSTLTNIGTRRLNELSDIIAEYSDMFDVAIDAYSDNTGNSQINLNLTSKRAEKVAEYISSSNRNIRIISVKGRGDANPVEDNSTAAGRAKNRRVEITLYPSATMTQKSTEGTLSSQVEQTADTVDPLDLLGGSFRPLTDAQKKELSISYGIQVTKVDKGKMKDAGIPQGFIIQRVNDENIKTTNDLQNAVKKGYTSKDPVLYIQGIFPTGKKGYFAVPLKD